jgi:hypothetical protein
MKQHIPTHHLLAVCGWVVVVLLAAQAMPPASAAERKARYQPPRTERGYPDLQGTWNFSSDVPLERPHELVDRPNLTAEEMVARRKQKDAAMRAVADLGVGTYNEFWYDYHQQIGNSRTSQITYPPDGRVPPLVPGAQRVTEYSVALKIATPIHPVRFTLGGFGYDGPEDRGIGERCLAYQTNPPLVPETENNYLQIVQSKDHVVLLAEQIHDARIVPLDGRPHADSKIRTWFGDSRGHWEGDTLVVETRNFNNQTASLDSTGSAFDKVVVERFTRVADNAIDYQATVVDPSTFTDKIVLSFPLVKFDGRLLEFACHEGNYAMPGILAGARAQEREPSKPKELRQPLQQRYQAPP